MTGKLQWNIARATLLFLLIASTVSAQSTIDLTLESAVDIMMNNSYRIRNVKMNIERTRYRLQAELAGLKSSVHMNLITPNLNNTSDYKWNSSLQRNEIVRENTNRWQMDLAIRQPIILLGYPTNGNVSLNYKIWRYSQSDGEHYTSFYNRLYLRLDQPFFVPNEKKNDLEEAHLDLEEEELDYLEDQVNIMREVSFDYYHMLELAHTQTILNNYIDNLEKIETIIAGNDSSSQLERQQIELQLVNAHENLLSNQSEIRIQKAQMIQKLRLHENDELLVKPVIKITPIEIDVDQAIEYGMTLRPQMRMIDIDKRKSEINLENTKSRNAFHVNLNVTYGLEKEDEYISNIWEQYDNSNSVTLNAYVPLWDWGRRRAQIEASKISVKQVDLRFEEVQARIKSDIINTITNLNEHQVRALNMQNSVKMASEITEASIAQFVNREISLQELFQTVGTQKETEINFFEAYIQYKNSLLWLTTYTYYDYEKGISLIDELRSKYGDD